MPPRAFLGHERRISTSSALTHGSRTSWHAAPEPSAASESTLASAGPPACIELADHNPVKAAEPQADKNIVRNFL